MLPILQYGILKKPMSSLKTASFTLHFIFHSQLSASSLGPWLEAKSAPTGLSVAQKELSHVSSHLVENREGHWVLRSL